jgi:hypothetical protein
MSIKRSITIIKADPGYSIVRPYDDVVGGPWIGVYYEPVVAWEIRQEEVYEPPYEEGDYPDHVSTDVIAIGARGGRSDGGCLLRSLVGPIAIKWPDGTYDEPEEDTHENEADLLKAWNKNK